MAQSTNSTDYGPRNFIGYGKDRPDAKWPDNARIAISVVLNHEEGSESCILNGDEQSESIASDLGPGVQPMKGERNVNMESLYEYGSRAGVWRLLRLFEEKDIRCTVFGVGQALEMMPGLTAEFEAAGHEIASHGYRWIDRSAWTAEEELAYAHKAIDAIRNTSPSGKAPRGFYYGNVQSKASIRSRALVAQVYRERQLELKYYSDDYSDDLPFWIPMPGGKPDEGLLIIPYTMLENDYKMGTAQPFVSGDDFTALLKLTFDCLYREGKQGRPAMMSIGTHSRLLGRPGRTEALRNFIDYAQSHEGVWFATREEIADHWKKTYPYKPAQN